MSQTGNETPSKSRVGPVMFANFLTSPRTAPKPWLAPRSSPIAGPKPRVTPQQQVEVDQFTKSEVSTVPWLDTQALALVFLLELNPFARLVLSAATDCRELQWCCSSRRKVGSLEALKTEPPAVDPPVTIYMCVPPGPPFRQVTLADVTGAVTRSKVRCHAVIWGC